MSPRGALASVIAAVLVPVAFLPISAAPAQAAPDCADYTFIGVAGSGEAAVSGGLGSIVSAAAQAFSARAQSAGKTVAVRAVRYPADAVPTAIEQVGPFVASVNVGAANTQGDVNIVLRECPSTKIVLVGYSQGASGVHRALQRLGDRPQVVAAGLIADPDRIPNDSTRKAGTAPPSQGIAQASLVISGANPAPLPPNVGRRTLSVCDAGDPVCQWTGALPAPGSTVHVDYSGADVGNQVAAIAGL